MFFAHVRPKVFIWRWKYRQQPKEGKKEGVSLKTSDKQVAEKRRGELLREKQHERDGLIASLEMFTAGHNPSSGVTTGNGAGMEKVIANIGESHNVTPLVTSGHNVENGGSGGARTRNLCRDRAAL